MAEGKKTIRIRKARQGDAVALFKLLQEAYGEAGPVHAPLDDDRLMLWVVDSIAQAEVWVADLSGRILGSIALVPFQYPWSATWVLRNRWLYVLENFRRRGTGRMLMEAVIRSADEKGAPLKIDTDSGGDWRDEFIGALDGMTYGGGTFFRAPKEVDHGAG